VREKEITRDRRNTQLAIAKSEIAKPRIVTSARDKKRKLNRTQLLTFNILSSLLGGTLMFILLYLAARGSQRRHCES